MHLASLRVDPMKFRRTSGHIRKTSIDHWQIVLRKRGSEFGSWGGRALRSQAGSIDIRSLATPCVATASASELICIWMSRDSFPDMAAAMDAACHKPIGGTMKIILSEFILAIERYRSTLTLKDVPVVVNSLAALVAAAIRPTADGVAKAAPPIAASLFELARKYIDANLSSPTLNVEALCRELHVSRRKLHYMFEHCGGLATFIRTRRLAACHLALENACDHRLVSTLAYDFGFSDPAVFSRAFRAQYGYTPRELRHSGTLAPLHRAAPSSFAQWLRVREL
ncbi:helix-turn-helix domain-containing protein [Rhizobium halophytocola]